MLFIIDKNEEFKGQCSSMSKPPYVDYSGLLYSKNGHDLTFNEYKEIPENKGKDLIAISENQFNKMMGNYEESLVTNPQYETEEEYYYGLEVLPPCRWHSVSDFSVFHISERLTGDLVCWHAKG